MFGNPSLMTRIVIGKTVGMIIGLIGFAFLPAVYPDATTMFRWGLLLWYTTFGAIIAVFGVFTWHPIIKLPMPWWVRAPFVGAWLNFVLVFFAYDDMQAVLTSVFGHDGTVTSPFLFVLEGAIAGTLIGYLATRFGGEGKETVQDQPT